MMMVTRKHSITHEPNSFSMLLFIYSLILVLLLCFWGSLGVFYSLLSKVTSPGDRVKETVLVVWEYGIPILVNVFAIFYVLRTDAVPHGKILHSTTHNNCTITPR